MDKMAILAASTAEPSVALRQRSDLLATLEPVVRLAPRFREILGTVSYFLFARSYLAASFVVASLYIASKFTIIRSYLLAKIVTFWSATLTKSLSRKVWDSKSCRRLRKKLEYEFFVLILGPGGNALCLMIFWPGWILAAAAIWAMWPSAGNFKIRRD